MDYLEKLPGFVESIRSMKETIITNILLVGQIPSPTYSEEKRTTFFLERLAEFQVDECTTDGYRNAIGIIRGQSRDKPPIFVVSRMDTPFGVDIDHHFSVKQHTISGTGLLDNSLGLGVILSLPDIFRKLELKFESDIVLAGVIESIGKGNQRGMRHLIKTWPTPIRGAICIESGELGRLNYYSDGMIRCEICCHVGQDEEKHQGYPSNAIVVLNEVINQVMEIRLPIRPRTRIILGTISGGLKHGMIAHEASLGLEIRSDSDEMVKEIYTQIHDIVAGIHHENDVDLTMETISSLRAARLRYNHPLVKSTADIMEKLGIEPVSEPSVSELSIFLSNRIPAVTLAVTYGVDYQHKEATMEISPMFTGIAQIVAAIMAIDSGVGDE